MTMRIVTRNVTLSARMLTRAARRRLRIPLVCASLSMTLLQVTSVSRNSVRLSVPARTRSVLRRRPKPNVLPKRKKKPSRKKSARRKKPKKPPKPSVKLIRRTRKPPRTPPRRTSVFSGTVSRMSTTLLKVVTPLLLRLTMS